MTVSDLACPGSGVMTKRRGSPPGDRLEGAPAGSLPLLLSLLADDRRKRILVQVSRAPTGLHQLEAALGIPRRPLREHLRRLCEAGLVRAERRRGQDRFRIGPRVTAIAGREMAYIRISALDGGEAMITIPLVDLRS